MLLPGEPAASKTGSMSGSEVISSTDMPGKYETGDPDVAGCPSVWYRATLIYKTAFGAAEVVEPAEPVDAVRAQPRALPSQLGTAEEPLGIFAASAAATVGFAWQVNGRDRSVDQRLA